MKQFLFFAQNDFSGFVLRVVLGTVMLTHGAQKLLGWFGGYGYRATMDYFTQSMKLPWFIALAIILVEFFGSIGLIVGFVSGIWAASLIVIMIGAIYTTNWKNGFFMNWFGSQSGEGYEYHLLVIAICIAVLLSGSGKYSIDKLLVK